MVKSGATGCPRGSLLGAFCAHFASFVVALLRTRFWGRLGAAPKVEKRCFALDGVVKITRRPTLQKSLKRRSKIGGFEVRLGV